MNKINYQQSIGIALNSKHNVPFISLNEESFQADEVVKIAQRYGIPIIEDSSCVDILSEFDLDDDIPYDLYEAMLALLDGIDLALKK